MNEDPVIREFEEQGRSWIAIRESGVAGAAVGPGQQIPIPPSPGIHFRAADGEARFLALEFPDLPSEEWFARFPTSELRSLLARATEITLG